ncbi:hypothetical protein SCNU_01820 [Gordonia neofelifaecis NRRL B-59395]|uniref:Uncharacterized protein n=1 Tax=Gordonia neofelifaecis NRRL B-59395 TaxID=644548 RepID=F1YDY4_9ACTN|nr:hypothetical protein SCNU_01820 [Gordonia neofelifaecis NRRL B-59395]
MASATVGVAATVGLFGAAPEPDGVGAALFRGAAFFGFSGAGGGFLVIRSSSAS